MNKIKCTITFPIQKVYESKHYKLIIIDFHNITHYWDLDGNYDGWCRPGQSNEIKLN